MKPSIKLTRILFFIILGIGIFMRLYQYLFGRNLWEDEAHLALNFIYYGYRDLCKPLANFQSASILFLFTEETFSRLFGFGALALRAFPLIASLLTLPLIYYIIQQLTRNKVVALIGFALYATNLYTIYFSAEIKPYIVDVSVYLLISYLVLSDYQWINKRRIAILGIAGCVAILYSATAPIILFCTGAYLIYRWYLNKKIVKQELYLLFTWGGVYILYFFLFLFHHPYAQGMREIWAFAFSPINIFSKGFVDFIYLRIQDSFFYSLLFISKDFGFAYIVLLVIIVATVYIVYNRKYQILFFTWLPVLVHLMASAFKLYPFYYRFILYLLPPLMILLAIGTYVIADFIARKVHFSLGILFVLCCCYFYVQPSVKAFPSRNHREVKPALDFINKNYPHAHIYITTPYTLYEYYNRIGYAKNSNYTAVKWNLSPEQYFESMKQENSNYILLSSDSSFGYIDGYAAVFKDLQKRHLIVRQFDHMTYQVSEIRPLTVTQPLPFINGMK